jgi:hypothetical protein
MGLAGDRVPPPTARRSSAPSRGSDSASAVKSFRINNCSKAQFPPRRFRRKRPMAVGELNPVAGDRRGDRDGGPASGAVPRSLADKRRGGGIRSGKVGASLDLLGVNPPMGVARAKRALVPPISAIRS